MALCFDLAAWMNPPTWIEQWQSGAYGEQRTGRELDKLPAEWFVLHDLIRSNGASLDHVLVGPPGVFLLDTKNIGTEVGIDGDELTALRPEGRTRYRNLSCAGSARSAASELSRALTRADGGCWVRAVVVVWGDMPQSLVRTRPLDWVSAVGSLSGSPACRAIRAWTGRSERGKRSTRAAHSAESRLRNLTDVRIAGAAGAIAAAGDGCSVDIDFTDYRGCVRLRNDRAGCLRRPERV